MADASMAAEAQDLVKGALEGLHRFIEAEVLPLEREHQALLGDERRLFQPDGRLAAAVLDARNRIRLRSAAAGFYTMLAPEAVGGGGLGAEAAVLVWESLGRRYGPGRILITPGKGFLTIPFLASFVDGPSSTLLGLSERVRRDYLPAMLRGERTMCFALTEPDAGSDVWMVRTRARREGGGWLLSGAKQWITNAPYADYAVIFAVTDQDAFARRRGGITAFFVEAKSPGFSVDGVLRLMGHLGSDCGNISLQEVPVRDGYTIGEVNGGFQVGMQGISEGRLTAAGVGVGISEWALDRCLEYAQQRVTFGVPLAEHQAIQLMLADSAIDIATAKGLALQAARLVDAAAQRGQRFPVKEVSMAKVYGTEAAGRVLDRAIQVHGALGLSGELALEEGYRLARVLRIPDGTSEIQRRTIARELLKGDTVF